MQPNTGTVTRFQQPGTQFLNRVISQLTRVQITQVKGQCLGERTWLGMPDLTLEQTANWRRHWKFTVNFSSTVKTFFTLAIISWCSLLTSPNQWSLQWLCHLGHFKNWLIDWLCGELCAKTAEPYGDRDAVWLCTWVGPMKHVLAIHGVHTGATWRITLMY